MQVRTEQHGGDETSTAESLYLVTRKLAPLDGRELTDFTFVPDPRIFLVEVVGEVTNFPAQLLSGISAGEPLP